MIIPELFILNYGSGVKFGPPEGDPRFLFFFLKGIIIVPEMKVILKIFNIRFLTYDVF